MYAIADRRTGEIIADAFDTYEEAHRYRRLLGGRERYAVLDTTDPARMPDIFTGASASPAASLAPGVCGLCARIGTNDLGGPTAHAPGCPNG